MAVTLMACYGGYGYGSMPYPDDGYPDGCQQPAGIALGETLSWGSEGGLGETVGSCGGYDTPEAVFAVQLDAATLGQAGTFTIVTSGPGATTYVRSACELATNEMACSNTGTLSFHVDAAAAFFILVDTSSWFDVSVAFVADHRCGDGVIDPGEQCDDGNTVGGDGCSAGCTVERCFGEVPLSLGPNAGDTSLGRDGITDLCSGVVGREVVYSYTPAEYGTLTLTLEAESDLAMTTLVDCSLEVEGSCGDTSVPVTLATSPGVPIHVTVGGRTSGAEGLFVLTATMKPSCGDGVVDPWEQCDDGNTADGDGCSAGCTAEIAVYCAAATPLVLGTNTGDTTLGQNLLAAACTGSQGKEALYSFTAPGDGVLVLDLDAQPYLGLYVLGQCPEGPVLGCADSAPGGQHETLSVHLSVGAACTIVVDGSGADEAGPFDLKAYFLP
ncbi:MAG: DUF4215 domain-containing protein [Minicystis sp.]